MTVGKLILPAKDNAVQLKINEIIDNMSGTITVDQIYNPTSQNPQSGVAIAGELSKYQPVLPSQSGNNGKFLTTNGTSVSWADATKVTFRDWSVS